MDPHTAMFVVDNTVAGGIYRDTRYLRARYACALLHSPRVQRLGSRLNLAPWKALPANRLSPGQGQVSIGDAL